MRELIVVRGVSGSGKSTWARRLQARRPPGTVEIIEADAFRTRGGDYVFDPRQSKAIELACLAAAESAMRKGVPCIVLANANTAWRAFARYIAAAHGHGYDVYQKILALDPEEAAVRSVHGTPLWVIRNQHKNLENSLAAERQRGVVLPLWQEDEDPAV